MKIAYEHRFQKLPDVSIVLLDWSVRESYHILDYLSKQTIPRERYEILWIEYYDRKPDEIEKKIKTCKDSNTHPVLNQWLIMEIPRKIYYHKHLMYNVGLAASSGKIICYCDSDAIVSPTFVESIISEFDTNANIVLHMDEIRSKFGKFYPFNYPTIEEIVSSDCMNLINGKPAGLVDKSSYPLHIPNYGACMCALRGDLISIGGSDEDMNYLGHICGPYEMTFRLVNFGRKELWHQTEWLYHTWHPSEGGSRNYMGPHDGMNMSILALEAYNNGRVFPLVENPVIKTLREKQDVPSASALLEQAIQREKIEDWSEDKIFSRKIILLNSLFRKIRLLMIGTNQFKEKEDITLGFFLKFLKVNVALRRIVFKMLSAQVSTRRRIMAMLKEYSKPFIIKLFQKIKFRTKRHSSFRKAMLKYNVSLIAKCWCVLSILELLNQNNAALYGAGSIAEILCVLSEYKRIKITALYDDIDNTGKLRNREVLPIDQFKDCNVYVIIASVVDMENMKTTLKKLGMKDRHIMTIG